MVTDVPSELERYPQRRSATFERAFADEERADLGPGLFDDFAYLIDLLVAQSAFGFLLQFEPHIRSQAWPILRAGIADLRLGRHTPPPEWKNIAINCP